MSAIDENKPRTIDRRERSKRCGYLSCGYGHHPAGSWRECFLHCRTQVGVLPLLDAPVGQAKSTETGHGSFARFTHAVATGQSGERCRELLWNRTLGLRLHYGGVHFHASRTNRHQAVRPSFHGWYSALRDRLDLCRQVFEIGVAGFLELERKLFAARFLDAAVCQHMHFVRHNVIQQALIVRDDDHRAALRAERVHAI